MGKTRVSSCNELSSRPSWTDLMCSHLRIGFGMTIVLQANASFPNELSSRAERGCGSTYLSSWTRLDP